MTLFCLAIFGQAMFGTMLLNAQVTTSNEEKLDDQLRPTNGVPRYTRTAEKKGDLWYEELKYYPEKCVYVKGFYKDEACKIAEGEVSWFYPNRVLQTKSNYVNGKLHGLYETWHQNGQLASTSTYANDHQKGVGIHYNEDGSMADSTWFDGNGKGSINAYGADGKPTIKGFYAEDNKRSGTWTYFSPDGKIRATEDYLNDKQTASACFDENGKALKGDACVSREATFGKQDNDWSSYISSNLDPSVPVTSGAPYGRYTVSVKFAVDKDGSIRDIKPQTKYGFGMEQEVVRILRKSPKWNPALMLGQPVKAWRIQPITFEVLKGKK